jgi:hypothetical protein
VAIARMQVGSLGPTCGQGTCGMAGEKTANGVDVTFTYTYGCLNSFTISLTGGSDPAPGAVTSTECVYTTSWAGLSSIGKGDAASGAVSIFSIVVFVIVFGAFPMYIGVGIAVKVKGQGEALDIEAVPQIEFWRSLPGLVKDGFVFTYTYVSALILMLPIHHATVRQLTTVDGGVADGSKG